MNTQLMFSHATDEWETPQALFDELDREFHFELDVCATDRNAKCPVYFTKMQDGLSKKWGGVYMLDEPSLRAGNWEMGQESVGRIRERRDGCVSAASENGHKMVA